MAKQVAIQQAQAHTCWGSDISDNMRHYHDQEWGLPQVDPKALFMQWTLQSFQCGLSWTSVLNKRPGFDSAFLDWDFRQVALFDDQKVSELLQDEGIIRHRGKIKQAIHLAQFVCLKEDDPEEEHGFPGFLWKYAPTLESERLYTAVAKPVDGKKAHMRENVKLTGEGRYVANAVDPTHSQYVFLNNMKVHYGHKYMGPAVALSLFQAIGFQNHHKPSCPAFQRCEDLYGKLKLPIGGAEFMPKPTRGKKRKISKVQ